MRKAYRTPYHVRSLPKFSAFQMGLHKKSSCHRVFVPKRRRKTLYGNIRKALGPIFHELARQKEGTIHEGHVMPDHIHMLVSIPPKFAVSAVIGFLKGKSVIIPFRFWRKRYRGRKSGRRTMVIGTKLPQVSRRPYRKIALILILVLRFRFQKQYLIGDIRGETFNEFLQKNRITTNK